MKLLKLVEELIKNNKIPLTNKLRGGIIKTVKEREENTMEDMIILTMKCPFCGEEHEVKTSEQDYVNYLAGDPIDVAFPNLNATKREQILSHICPKCQDEVFVEY